MDQPDASARPSRVVGFVGNLLRGGLALSGALVVLGAASAAGAAGTGGAGAMASSSVLSRPGLSGFSVISPGPFNGPVTAGEMAAALGGSKAVAGSDALEQGVGGYIRTWVQQGTHANSVDVVLFRFTSATTADDALDAWNLSTAAKPSVETFPVPSVVGAFGYAIPSAGGTTFQVDFVQGSDLSMVNVVTSGGALGSADAVAVADKQATLEASAPRWEKVAALAALAAGGLVALVLVVRTALFAVRRFSQRTRGQGRRRAHGDRSHGVGRILGPAASEDLAATAPTVATATVGAVALGTPDAAPATRAPRVSKSAAPARGPAPGKGKQLGQSKPFVTAPPPPPENAQIGWTSTRDGSSVQWYWDGQAWTGRRRLTPAGWVDDD